MKDRGFKRDDIVVEEGRSWDFMIVLTYGPKTFEVLERCGGTTRYRDRPAMRLATDADFNHDPASREKYTAALRAEATKARAERRRGARVRRGHVTNYPKRKR